MGMLWDLAWMMLGACLGVLVMALLQVADEDKDE